MFEQEINDKTRISPLLQPTVHGKHQSRIPPAGSTPMQRHHCRASCRVKRQNSSGTRSYLKLLSRTPFS